MRIIFIFFIFIMLSACSGFTLLVSGGSLAISQNSYAKIYNSVDVLTVISTDKSIKKHAYDKTLGLVNNH